MKKIGFLGLGVMGLPMALNVLKKSGYPVLGFDVAQARLDQFAAAGGETTSDPVDIYKTCDVIMQMLPTHPIIINSIKQAVQYGKPGNIILDLDSTAPDIIQELYPEVEAAGMHLLDSPVSGGETGANGGSLVIMSGGEKEVFEEVKPYLLMMGKSATYMGPSGCGSTAKIANNMMVGIHLLAMDEAYAFATKAGLDPKTLFDAIHGGFAQSAVMDLKVPKILSRDFSASARIAVHLKDVNNAMELAEHLGVEIPMTKIVKEQMDWMDAHGMIDEDQCALVKYYEDAMSVEVK